MTDERKIAETLKSAQGATIKRGRFALTIAKSDMSSHNTSAVR